MCLSFSPSFLLIYCVHTLLSICPGQWHSNALVMPGSNSLGFFYPCRSISMLSFWLDANFLYRCPVTQTPTTPPQSAPVPSLAPVQVQDEANGGEENYLVGLKFDPGTLAYLYAITHYFTSLTCQFVTNFSVLFLIIFLKVYTMHHWNYVNFACLSVHFCAIFLLTLLFKITNVVIFWHRL